MVDGDGTWVVDFSGLIDLRGWDEVEATWTSPAGDTFQRSAAVPFLFVRRGGSYVEANGRPGTDVTITLRDGSDHVRGAVRDTADLWGWVDGTSSMSMATASWSMPATWIGTRHRR